MQRVRVGLTGLAFVFLLVMLATAFLRMAGGSEATGNATLAPTNSTAPSEPLAQLGVVPGNPQQADPAPAAKPGPAPSSVPAQ
ncbi:hypothetical protein Q4F19_03795 [Sphingomonas sp. BIUV-7]|uniref:Uncharacterized protein n=1 Tax=Sphingomonas natans TaxID=3063330 RepID=A0ABT8Y5A3_9SPHN|nr:hypothetical protein [Sphingomonas sp. BIUV-7]MDO6413498.1 hypothetical protein [Sphingomonas sp. BIUV-7]